MSKWTDWIPHEETAPFPYKGEVVQLQTLPDGSVRYKRLRKNVEAEKLDAEIDAFMEDDPEAEEATPTPIITGPGEYVTRDGRKAAVQRNSPFDCAISDYPFHGHVKSVGWFHWKADGTSREQESYLDITGPWQDPENPEPHVIEGWVNVYENSVSGHFGRVYPTEDMAHLNKAKDSHAPYLATIRISYTIEDTTQ